MSGVSGPAESRFSELLREFRQRAGMTQEGLAERAGLSVRTLRNAERRGGYPPHYRSVRRLGDALALDAADRDRLIEAVNAVRSGLDSTTDEATDGAAQTPTADGAAVDAAVGSEWVLEHGADPLIGRDDVVRAVVQLLRDRPRVVTITGLPGVGKTGVAVAVAKVLATGLPGGVRWVSMRARRDRPTVPAAVAEATGHPDLAAFARSAQREALLVLDGIEHAGHAAAGIDELRAACPTARILVTGRQPTHAADEYQWVLCPLAVPPDGVADAASLATVPAVAMFVDRLLRRRPGYRLTDDDAPAVAALTRLLEGVPLALELAAGRGRVQSPADLLARYGSRMLDLAQPAPAETTGARSLRDSLAESSGLLAADDQRRLAELALFVRSWTLELARSYLGGGDEVDTLVDQLSGMGLVQTSVDRGTIRFHLPDSVREFGLERLAAGGELAPARRRHALAVLEWSRRLAEQLTGPAQARCGHELDRIGGDIVEALGWAVEHGHGDALRTAATLARYWRTRGRTEEGVAWIERLMAGDAPPATRAYARVEAARLLVEGGHHQRAQGHLDRAIDEYRARGDLDGQLDVLIVLSKVLRDQGRFDDGAACSAMAFQLATRSGDARRRVVTMHNLIFDDLRLGRFDTANRRLDQLGAIPLLRADTRMAALLAMNQAEVLYAAGRLEDCRAAWERAVDLIREGADQTRLAKALSRLAICEAELGHPERAANLLAKAGDAEAETADGLARPWLALSTGVVAALRRDPRAARRELRSALDGFTVLGQLREQVETLLRLAAVSTDRGEAASLIDRARRLAAEKGIHLSERERQQLRGLSRADGWPDNPRDDSWTDPARPPPCGPRPAPAAAARVRPPNQV
jgi:predicted ATPase/transcriptional regulator with XRE-family HTH domain